MTWLKMLLSENLARVVLPAMLRNFVSNKFRIKVVNYELEISIRRLVMKDGENKYLLKVSLGFMDR